MATEIDTIIADIEKVTTKVIKKMSLDIVANLQEITPVDTGWARANWIPSIGSSHSLDGTPPKDPEEAKSAVAARAAIAAEGVSRVANYEIKDGAIFISNNVPYIKRLDEGHSQKAPAGFVRQSVEIALTQNLKELDNVNPN